jgi:hypothetical protein
MAESFTGFWEATGPGIEDDVATTISYWSVERLLARLRERLEAVPPGTIMRIELIAWDDGA